MRRSEIDRAIDLGLAFVDAMDFALPPFARWTTDDWRRAGPATEEIRATMLGWDVTDFGTGDFARYGVLIFTLRNGRVDDPRYPKTYAEKVLVQAEGQLLPFHVHFRKTEDIINRAGGNLMVGLANAGPDRELIDTPVVCSVDGQSTTIAGGSAVRLSPGQSVTIPPLLYHSLWAEPGSGMVLAGEVSSVNDDRVDNYFPDYADRLPAIEEDEPARHRLFSDPIGEMVL